MQYEGCVAEPLHTITAILPGSTWSDLLFRVVLQDALSAVTRIYPPLKFTVFVDDITALLMGDNKEVAEMAKKVMKIFFKEEVEKKASNCRSHTNGKEGKSKMIASCGFLESELSQFSEEEGVTMAFSVETLGVDLRTRVKRLGVKEKARRKKCKVRFSLIKKNKAFQKSYMKVGRQEVVEDYGTSKSVESACSGVGPYRNIKS